MSAIRTSRTPPTPRRFWPKEKQPATRRAACEIYGTEPVARAIEDAFIFEAFSSEYIANLLQQRARFHKQPAALHLTRREDLLDIRLEHPDLSVYERIRDE